MFYPAAPQPARSTKTLPTRPRPWATTTPFRRHPRLRLGSHHLAVQGDPIPLPNTALLCSTGRFEAGQLIGERLAGQLAGGNSGDSLAPVVVVLASMRRRTAVQR